MASNIEELKRKFYKYQYNGYLNYLRYWDYRNSNDEYSINLRKIFQKDYEGKFSYTTKDGKIIQYYHKVSDEIANEAQKWSSVDEFFDIIGMDENITLHVNTLIEFINDPNFKNPSETRDLSEDSIIKLIARYFCEKNGLANKVVTKSKKAARGNEYIEIKNGEVTTKVTDSELKAQFHIKEDVKLMDDLSDQSTFFNAMGIIEKDLFFKGSFNSGINSLDWNLSNSVKYLQAVKDLRNGQFHHVVEMISKHDADPVVILRFVLYSYIHVVLALRMSMVLRNKGNYPQKPILLRVHRKSEYSWDSLGIKLYKIDNDKEIEVEERPSIEPITKVFEVYRFNKYVLTVNGGASDSIIFGPKCFSPIAVVDKIQPKLYQSDTEAPSAGKKITTDDYFEVSLTHLSGIKEDTKKISDGIEKLGKEYSDRIDEQRKEERKRKEEEQKKEEERRNREKEERKREEERRQKEDEEKKAIEKKRRSRLYLFGGCVATLLIASVGIFIWCIIYDNSLLWLQHKTSILCISSFVVLAFGFAVYQLYKSYNNHDTKKLLIFIGVTLLFVLFIVGSYIATPYKTAKDFVASYNFSTHDKNDNVNAVDVFIKSLDDDDFCDIVTSKLIDYYINYEKDSTNINKAIELSDKVIGNITKYPKSKTYAAYAYFAKARFGVDKKLYAPINYIFDNSNTLSTELTCLKGIMTVYGLGVEKNVEKGIAMLQESANRGNSKAQYYLGFVYSRDLTDWDAYRKGKNILPFNNINLYWAIIYLQMAADNRPEAMLELANIYNDLNLTDKAILCYNKVIERANGEVLKSANFKMGLLQERMGNKDNKYLADAISSAYAPAIIHKGEQDKDYVKLIGYYLTSTLPQYRYIPPIVFCYLHEAEFDNALKTLQTNHKNGGFDRNFIDGMNFLLGITVDKDSVKGYKYMNKSADNGCVFAKMMCDFRDQEKSSRFQFSRFNDYCDEIPFAHVLRSWLLARKGQMDQAQPEAMKAISLRHPAGAYMLKFTEDKHTMLLSKWDMAFRTLPNNVNKQDCVFFGFYYRSITEMVINHKQIPIDELEYWAEIAKANHCFDVEIMILQYLYSLDKNDEKMHLSTYKELIEAALSDATGINDSYPFRLLSFLINGIPGFYEELKSKYQYDIYIQSILAITPTLYNDEALEVNVTDRIAKMNNSMPNSFTDCQILTELDNMGNEFVDYYPM